MRKMLATLIFVVSIVQTSWAQENSIRPTAIGVSFFFNDFVTPQRIRSGNLSQVLRDHKWAKFREMAPGLALTYFKGLKKHIDFAGTASLSFPSISLPQKAASAGDAMLLEADASFNFKMFTEDYWFTPYLIAGFGASKYKSYYGAFMPLGGGLKVNFYDEAALFITSQYRIPVTNETNDYHLFYSIGIAGVIGNKKD